MAADMGEKPICITVAELKLFHRIDRTLYSLLVTEFQRDPLQSMKIMAFWLWMELSGFYNVVKKILLLPHFLINKVADEAVTCLTCIENNQFQLSTDATPVPLTQRLMPSELTPLLFFDKNRDEATTGIRRIITKVCLKALPDITKKALKKNPEQTPTESKMSPPGESSSTRFGDERNDVPRGDRTMFLTFSKGYPVCEWEVREFFTRLFGECIECILMQDVKPPEQSLYARVVFVTPLVLESILKGVPKAKFTINGKHVWMRKFIPKNGKSFSCK